MTGRQQFFEHDGDFDAVGRGEGVELQRVLTDGQVDVFGGAGNGAVDVGELTATFLLPLPDFGGRVALR